MGKERKKENAGLRTGLIYSSKKIRVIVSDLILSDLLTLIFFLRTSETLKVTENHW